MKNRNRHTMLFRGLTAVVLGTWMGAGCGRKPAPPAPVPEPQAPVVAALPVLEMPSGLTRLLAQVADALPTEPEGPLVLQCVAGWDAVALADVTALAGLLEGDVRRLDLVFGGDGAPGPGQVAMPGDPGTYGLQAIPTRYLLDARNRLRAVYAGSVDPDRILKDLERATDPPSG